MEGQELTLEKKDSIYLRPRYPHKIDGSKIKSLEDVIKILGLMNICLDDKAVKGLEHLIEKGEEVEVGDYKITGGVMKGEQLK